MGAVKSGKISHKSVLVVSFAVGILLIGACVFGITYSICKILENNRSESAVEPDEDSSGSSDDPAKEPEEPEKPPIKEVDFQPVIDNWVKTVGGNRSVLVYDLNLNKIVGSYNSKENYNTASLYKLFVVYEGYKRLANGSWIGSDPAGRTGKTILECLDLAIRESDSTCAETLWGLIGRMNLAQTIESEWGIKNSDISNLISNPEDIMLIMKRFYEHPDFESPDLIAKMWDSFLNQPPTTYNWRQGLPSGFTKASVYNKVGWDFDPDEKYWKIYHDAAIVKFPLQDGTTRDFIVVVMTNKVDFKNIKKFATMLESKFYEEQS